VLQTSHLGQSSHIGILLGIHPRVVDNDHAEETNVLESGSLSSLLLVWEYHQEWQMLSDGKFPKIKVNTCILPPGRPGDHNLLGDSVQNRGLLGNHC
jgi:hypothetical protein